MKKPHTAENGDLIHTTEDNEASDISIITISFVRKTNKQILKNSKVCLKRYKLKYLNHLPIRRLIKQYSTETPKQKEIIALEKKSD